LKINFQMSLDSLPSDVSEDFSQLNLKVSPYKFASNILIEQDGKVYINSSSHSPSSFHKRTLQVKIKDPETKRRINLSK